MRANNLGYFEGQITKYVTRWQKKGGLEDLYKAKTYLEKLIHVTELKSATIIRASQPCENYKRLIYMKDTCECGWEKSAHTNNGLRSWKGYE